MQNYLKKSWVKGIMKNYNAARPIYEDGVKRYKLGFMMHCDRNEVKQNKTKLDIQTRKQHHQKTEKRGFESAGT